MTHAWKAPRPSWVMLAALPFALVLVTGCGDDDAPPPGACVQVDGECVGVPLEPLCADAVCTSGVTCARVLGASSGAELTARVAEATQGDCIALSPGSYPTADLPGGVSLLGHDAADVHVGSVRLGAGTGAVIRGIGVIGGGIDAGDAKDVLIDAVMIAGGGVGLRASAGSSIRVSRSEIRDTIEHGLLGVDAAVTIDHTLVAMTNGPGIWLQCGGGSDGCACPEKSEAAFDHVRIHQHKIVGVSLIGVHATMSHVDVIDGRPGTGFAPAGGMSVSACSKLEYDDVFVKGLTDQSSYGILVDRASAAPLSKTGAAGIIIVDGMPGLWLQGVGAPVEEPDQTVVLTHVDVRDCSVAGIGFDLGAHGIIIVDGKVSNTKEVAWPVEVGGKALVGYGIVWKDGSAAQIDGLEIAGSAGLGALIDGAVGTGSSISGLALGGGDEVDGLVQQQVTAGDEAPALDSTATLQQHEDSIADVPVGPALPAQL